MKVTRIIKSKNLKLVDKAEFIAAEDLTSPIASKKFGKNVTKTQVATYK